MAAQDFDYLYKVLVVGDVQVGKSSFVSRYTKNIIDPNQGPTLAIEYQTKNLILRDGSIIKAQIWDTCKFARDISFLKGYIAGSERYRSITTNYYRKSAGVLLFFDLTDRGSFDNISKWLQDIWDYTEEGTVTMIIGNKKDLTMRDPGCQAVPTEEAMSLARKYNLLYHETSAKTGMNVKEAFEDLVQTIYDKQQKTKPNGEGEYAKQLKIKFKTLDENQIKEDDKGCCFAG